MMMTTQKTDLRAHFYSAYVKGRKAWETAGPQAVNPYLDQRDGAALSVPSFSSAYRRYWGEGRDDAKAGAPDRYARVNGAADLIAKKAARSKAKGPVRMTVVARGVVSGGTAMVTVPEWDANTVVFVPVAALSADIVRALSTQGGKLTALGNKKARITRLLRLTDFEVAA